MTASIVLAGGLLQSAQAQAGGTGISHRSIRSGGQERAFYLFIPEKPAVRKSSPLPLVVLLHGTGGDGREQIEAWKKLAEREAVLLVAPTGKGKYGWQVPIDGPEFLYDVVEQVKKELPVDGRRVYLFGYSNGADMAFYIAPQQSQYYAAAVMFAGSLRQRQFAMLDHVKRKIPLAYFIGGEDKVYPLAEAHPTRDAVRKRGIKLEYREISGAGHDFGGRYGELLEDAWKFLRDKSLTDKAKYAPLDETWLGYALK
ncbi:MAG: dienelactone hydrolase family protein [Acidobacteriales bacterium]|nr:dienelactone hydrolase family protein [Terriglobales bacterium]